MSDRGRRATDNDYQLLSINDVLSCLGQRVNLMGVITEHSLPKKSGGTDYWCLLAIIDESYHSRGFVVNLFGNSMDKLPQVESSGDIIRLSQVMILHKCEDNQGESMLFVWDGTDAPLCSIQERLDNEKDSPLPLQIEGASLSRDTASKFPTAGTVLRVKLELELHSSTLVVGRWVKLIGLTFEVHAGLWYGIFASCTRIKYIPEGDCRILKPQSDFDNRISSKWGRVPFSCVPWPRVPRLVTETEKPDDPLVTLVDIIKFSQVTTKFKCVVRVVAILPSNPKEFRSPNETYKIRLTLEDPTARLHAYLYR